MLDVSLSERKKEILRAIISDYIFTAEPVSSGAVTKRYIKDLSPATIRNVMAQLEEMEYLCQPHTSSGRIPTDKGFRVYVDHLMQRKALPQEEKEEIRRVCSYSGQEVIDFIRDVSRSLSAVSHHPGLASIPRFTDVIVKHIEFVKLKERQALVTVVSQGGVAQNRIVDLDEELRQSDLDRITKYLNELFTGLTITEIKLLLLEEMKREKRLYDRLLKKALRLWKDLLERSDLEVKEIFIEGQSRFFEYPEFLDIEKMKEIFRAFEEKNTIIRLLDKSLNAKGVHIFIGCETGSSKLKGCSLITASYKIKENTMGSIGIIGPVRMDYSHIIPLVGYTANVVERMLREG